MILLERKMTSALSNIIFKCIVFAVLFHAFQHSFIFPVILEITISFASVWTDQTVEFILCCPWFFP